MKSILLNDADRDLLLAALKSHQRVLEGLMRTSAPDRLFALDDEVMQCTQLAERIRAGRVNVPA